MARRPICTFFLSSVVAIAATAPFAFADADPPAAILASVQRAKYFVEQGQLERAVSILYAAISGHEDSGVLFLTRALLQQRVNRHRNAIDDFSRAIDLDFRPALAYASRGASRLATGDREGAIADLGLAIKADPDLGMARLLRGRIHYEDGQFPLALQDLNNANGIEGSMEGLICRAFCQLRSGEYVAACADATRASMIDSSDPTPIYIRMSAHLERGDEEAAAADYQLAKRLETNATR